MDIINKMEKISHRFINFLQEVISDCKSEANQNQSTIQYTESIKNNSKGKKIEYKSKEQQKFKNKQKKIQHNQKKTATSKDKFSNKPVIEPPKKPLTTYLLFFKERKPKIATLFPKLNITEISKVVSRQWAQLSQQKKKSYILHYLQEKEKYNRQLANYKKIYPDYDDRPQKKSSVNPHDSKKTKTIQISSSEEQQIDEQQISPIIKKNISHRYT